MSRHTLSEQTAEQLLLSKDIRSSLRYQVSLRRSKRYGDSPFVARHAAYNRD